MWELGICWETSAILRVPKLEVSSTNPSGQRALTLIGQENSPMESWRFGIPAGRRVTPTLTRSLSISSHAAAAASRREESSKADRSSSISRSFALPCSVFRGGGGKSKRRNANTANPSATHSLALPSPTQPTTYSTATSILRQCSYLKPDVHTELGK